MLPTCKYVGVPPADGSGIDALRWLCRINEPIYVTPIRGDRAGDGLSIRVHGRHGAHCSSCDRHAQDRYLAPGDGPRNVGTGFVRFPIDVLAIRREGRLSPGHV